MKMRFLAILAAAVCAFGGCGALDRETEEEVREELKNAAAQAGSVLEEAKEKASEKLAEIDWAEMLLVPDSDSEKKNLKVLCEGTDGQWTEIEDMEEFRKQADVEAWEKTDAIPADMQEAAHFSIQQKGTIHLGEEDTDRYYEIAEMTLYADQMVSLTILGDITQYLDVVLPQGSFTANYLVDEETAEYLRSLSE
ncbi:hypothetical protein H9X85_07370 [Anaerotignum lactatifermentans]|uniref:Uncharacterized protein n=1 Tax=Anaerotignum lactatifermentans TaxID=160404 RepID=A0ABS2GB82_9FIRM|nr:hypothetical protein [Anaerotignum lactatifermentans]MBM6829450.1 hypothetical protein [Anaerotignum lactatifermentans]MBM6877808.1 hypothetical protein [Anaerotignum lactatifermentans]MBM6951027.1 hypothetical protein [Anaerotignum lactatifermentans]